MSEDNRYLVLGTAGHIDHGKTTLIKALTGTDCDRLAEERDRGITIDIGIAHWDLPGGVQLGIVDMPGHRRFIRNMVAGAVGIDIVMLVIAADDGVMPQTREHLHIARLLGVRSGLVALTKTDMVDQELTELATADVEELIEGTFLEGCPIIPVSGITGAGLDQLTETVTAIAADLPSRSLGDRFRMPIDRNFSIKGVGTVVTGTTLAGTVKVDDELEVVPGNKRVRVRGIQIHGEAVKECGAGFRAALNVVGIDKDEVTRGHVLVTPNSLETTYMFDAEVELLAEPHRPLKRGVEVMVHIGTTELAAKLFPLEDELLMPGTSGLVQFRLNQELAVAVGDRMIVRDSESENTIGGGMILDAHPNKHRRKRAQAAEDLADLRGAGRAAALLHEVAKSPFGLDAAAALKRLHMSPESMQGAVKQLIKDQTGLREHQVGSGTVLTLPVNRERILSAGLRALQAYHDANPLVRQGLTAAALVKAIDRSGSGVPREVLGPALETAVKNGTLLLIDNTYAIPKTDIKLSQKDRKAIETITKTLNASTTADQPDELLDELPVDRKRLRQLLDFLVETGEVVTHSKVYFGRRMVEQARERMLRYFQDKPGLTVSEFGQLVGSTRKYSVPFLNYFEAEGFLKRVDNDRVLNPDWQAPGAEAVDSTTEDVEEEG